MDELKETVRMDSDCGLAYYYAGMIHQEKGEMDEAEMLLQKSIKLMSPDRRPINALKSLSHSKEKQRKRRFFRR